MPCKLSGNETHMLYGMYKLRFLNTSQINRVWYKRKQDRYAYYRLKRLAEEKVIKPIRHRNKILAWTLGKRGYEYLRSNLIENIEAQKKVSPSFVEHMLDVSQVYFILSGDQAIFERAGFLWDSGGAAKLCYTQSMRDRFGVYRTAQRFIRPDAIISPLPGQKGKRIFLELDRGTERIFTKTEQSSIEDKLSAYATYLFKGDIASNVTWYQNQYEDNLPAKVVFVVSNKKQRRVESIQKAMHAFRYHGLDVEVMQLCEHEKIIKACGIDMLDKSAMQEPKLHQVTVMSKHDFDMVVHFYLQSVPRLKSAGVLSDRESSFYKLTKKTKRILKRLCT